MTERWRVVAPASLGPHEGAITLLAEAGCLIDRLPDPFPGWDEALIARHAAPAQAFVGTFRGAGLPRAAIAAAPRLRVIVSPIIGVEHIDVAAATEFGVLVAHGAIAENFDGMAEAAVMLIAATLKNLSGKQDALAHGRWKQAPLGRMVAGATVGFLGFGRIARAAARRLQGWDCRLVACDPYAAPEGARDLGVVLTDLVTLLSEADALVVLVTLTAETRNLIDAAALARMKPGATLINVARGGVVDEVALAAALADGRLSAAAIDAWAQEPPPQGCPLIGDPRVIATGHDVGHSRELAARLPAAAAEHALAALAGQIPACVANPEVLDRWLAGAR